VILVYCHRAQVGVHVSSYELGICTCQDGCFKGMLGAACSLVPGVIYVIKEVKPLKDDLNIFLVYILHAPQAQEFLGLLNNSAVAAREIKVPRLLALIFKLGLQPSPGRRVLIDVFGCILHYDVPRSSARSPERVSREASASTFVQLKVKGFVGVNVSP